MSRTGGALGGRGARRVPRAVRMEPAAGVSRRVQGPERAPWRLASPTGAGQGSTGAGQWLRARARARLRHGLRSERSVPACARFPPGGGRSAACGPRVRRGRARCACRSRTGAVAPDRRWGGAHDDGDDDGDIGAGARWALLRVFPRAGAAGPVRPVDHRQGVAPPVFRPAGKRSGGLRLSGPDGPSRSRAHRTRRLGGTRPSRTTRLCSPVRRRGTAAGGRCGA